MEADQESLTKKILFNANALWSSLLLICVTISLILTKNNEDLKHCTMKSLNGLAIRNVETLLIVPTSFHKELTNMMHILQSCVHKNTHKALPGMNEV